MAITLIQNHKGAFQYSCCTAGEYMLFSDGTTRFGLLSLGGRSENKQAQEDEK